MPATVQIVIEGDDAGASAALDQISVSADKASESVARLGATGDSTFSQMQANTHATMMETDLLTGNISRAENSLMRMAAATSTLGPIIQMAFAPLVLITFVELLGHVVENVDKLTGSAKEETQAWK